MTKLLEQAIAKAQSLPPEDQDALALAMLSLTEGDASTTRREQPSLRA
jgi:hypothetical protein